MILLRWPRLRRLGLLEQWRNVLDWILRQGDFSILGNQKLSFEVPRWIKVGNDRLDELVDWAGIVSIDVLLVAYNQRFWSML